MKRLHPSTMIVAFLPEVVKAVKTALPFLFVSMLSSKNDWEELIAPIIGILSGFGAVSAYLTTRYGIEDRQLIFRRGWLFRQDRRIPLEQVHNVNVRQGLLERIFRVVTLEVETAAGKGAEMKLQVIKADEAEGLRLQLLGGREPIQEKEPRPSFRIDRDSLLLGAVTENHAWSVFGYLASLIAGSAALQFVAIELAALKLLPPWVTWLLGIAAFAGIMVLGWLWGVLTYSLKYGNFTVLEEPGIYRISHGVLTRNQYAARLSRLETVVVRATLWQRRIGRCNLSIGTAGTFGEQGILAPVAMMLDEKVLPQRIESVCPPCRIEEDRWQPLPKRYRWTLVARWAMTTVVLMIPVAATVLQAYRHGGSPFMHAMLFIVPAGTLAMFASSLLGTIRAGYAVGEDVVASRYGFFTQTTSVMPLERIEVAMESQPPFWRRHGLVALDVKGMTHQVAFPMLPKEVSDAIVERVAERSRARQDAKRQATEEGPGGSGMPSLPPSFPSYRAASIPAEHPSSDSGSSIG